MGSRLGGGPTRLAVAITAALLIAATQAVAVASATSGTLVLTQSTTLTADYYGTILIQADNVTLDCAGHTVYGPGDADYSGGIQIDWANGAVVRRCTVTGFVNNGLYGHDATNIRIEGSAFVGNGNHGVHLDAVTNSVVAGNRVSDNGTSKGQGFGFVLTRSSGIKLTGNVASGSPWSGFAVIDGTTGSTLTGNRSTANVGEGFLVEASTGNRLVSNTSTANGTDGSGQGFWLRQAANGNELRGNVASGNAETGFRLDQSGGNRLIENTATHNGGSVWGSGFFLDQSDSNVLERNTGSQNGEPGDDVDGFRVQGSAANVLRANVANGNATWGFILVGNPASAPGNLLDGNTANGNAIFGFALNGATRNTLTANAAGGNGQNGFDLCCASTANRLQGNVASNNGAVGFAVTESSGNTLVANTARTNAGDGIRSSSSTGNVFRQNTLTRNGGFGLGVWDSSGVVVDRNVVTDSGDAGIVIVATADSRISGNVVRGARQGGHGFMFNGSSGLRIEDNTADHARYAGFSLQEGTQGSTLTGNTATACDAGFDVGTATGNTLKGNRAVGSLDGPGFALGPGSESNVLSGNSAMDNLIGFQLWSYGVGTPAPAHNLLTANVANRNATVGFLVQEAASYNSFTRNSAHANGEWDALQSPDAGPGNVWVGNSFGTATGF
jgi:parallel beta-helix repeat protein